MCDTTIYPLWNPSTSTRFSSRCYGVNECCRCRSIDVIWIPRNGGVFPFGRSLNFNFSFWFCFRFHSSVCGDRYAWRILDRILQVNQVSNLIVLHVKSIFICTYTSNSSFVDNSRESEQHKTCRTTKKKKQLTPILNTIDAFDTFVDRSACLWMECVARSLTRRFWDNEFCQRAIRPMPFRSFVDRCMECAVVVLKLIMLLVLRHRLQMRINNNDYYCPHLDCAIDVKPLLAQRSANWQRQSGRAHATINKRWAVMISNKSEHKRLKKRDQQNAAPNRRPESRTTIDWK